MLQRKKLLPRLMSGVTFHFCIFTHFFFFQTNLCFNVFLCSNVLYCNLHYLEIHQVQVQIQCTSKDTTTLPDGIAIAIKLNIHFYYIMSGLTWKEEQ